jgi:hypothetical protein
VAEADIQALNERVAFALSSKLVKAIRKFLKQLTSSLLNKFTLHFEEEGGVRRAWNSDLGEDAARAEKETVLALSQLILVPQGLNVPGVSESVFTQSQVSFPRYRKGCEQLHLMLKGDEMPHAKGTSNTSHR